MCHDTGMACAFLMCHAGQDQSLALTDSLISHPSASVLPSRRSTNPLSLLLILLCTRTSSQRYSLIMFFTANDDKPRKYIFPAGSCAMRGFF